MKKASPWGAITILSFLIAASLTVVGYLYLINPSLPGAGEVAGMAGFFVVVFLACRTLLKRYWSSRLSALDWKRAVLYVVLAAAGGAAAVSLFPHFPRLAATQAITIRALEGANPRSQGSLVRVVSLHSDLPPSAGTRFHPEGSWQPYEEGFEIEDGGGASLTWRGRVLNSATAALEASPAGGMVLITWAGGISEQVDLYADTPRVITAGHEFQPSFVTRAAVIVLLGLPVALAGFLLLVAVFPVPLLRIRFLESRPGFRLFAFAALAAALTDVLENSGLLREYTLRDSSVFLYSGQNILDGGVPYRDVWDHKGPLIYLINALGLAVGDGSRLGVFLVECLVLLAIFWFFYRGVESAWGSLPAFGASVVLLAGFDRLYDGGNLTEEYAVLFQVLSILVLLSFLRRPKRADAVWMGLLAALGFLLRPNLVSTQVVAGGILLLEALRLKERDRPYWKTVLAGLAAGFLTPVLCAVLVFASQGALGDFVEQTITYNLLYSSNSGVPPLEQLAIPWKVLKPLWITPLVLAGLGLGLFGLLKEKERITQRLLLLGCLDFLIGLWVYNASGRGFRHYFLNLLPAAGILVGYLTWKAAHANLPFRKRLADSGPYLFAAAMAAWTAISLAFYLPDISQKARAVTAEAGQCPYLDEVLAPEDTVLMWGIETPFYITSGRRAPTRFLYQTPLTQPWYATAEMGEELVRALEEEKTPVIIDTSPTNSEFPPLSGDFSQPGSAPGSAAIPILLEYIAGHYRLEGSLPCYGEEWLLYRRVS